MIENSRKLEDGESGRGSVNTVTRRGDSVFRTTGPWSPAVHHLLQHLEAVGFEYSPRLLSTDPERGCEELTYIEGEVSMRPWPECLCVDSGIEAIGRMLRKYHDAVRDYVPPADAVWRVPDSACEEGMIIRHGDLGPWNFVWKSGRLIGLIDWDFAEPGFAIDDVAQAAWNCVPLRPEKPGDKLQDQRRRLGLLCESYGIDPAPVFHALDALIEREIDRTLNFGNAEVQPWADFLERGDIAEMEAERAWLRAHYITE